MNPLAHFVQASAHDFCPAQTRLPPALWSVFTAFNTVHGLWRWYRRTKLYSNPDNFSQLLAGHAANQIFGDVFLLKVAAQCLLIATRILQCAEKQASLYREGKKLIDAFYGHYPAPVHTPWPRATSSEWLSPSTVQWWQSTSINVCNRIARIASIALNCCKKAFMLSMMIMDAVDAFYLSPATQNEGIQEGLVNAIKWLNAIVDKKEDLLSGISQNKEIIEKILNKSQFTYEQLHSAVSRTLEQTEAVHSQANRIASFGNGILVDFGKRALNGGMVVAGLSDYRPTALAIS